jgi:hypothetical protein
MDFHPDPAAAAARKLSTNLMELSSILILLESSLQT